MKRTLSDWFRQWRTPLRRFLTLRGGVRSADLDDVAQDVFLRLMRYERAGLIGSPQAYLFKMASNVAAEWSMRARHRHPHDSQWLGELQATSEPEEEALRASARHEVHRGLMALQVRQREVLRLHFAEGLSHDCQEALSGCLVSCTLNNILKREP